MLVNAPHLESRVAKLNEWLQHHNEQHHLHRQQLQKRDYYVNKLCEMDELGIKTINI